MENSWGYWVLGEDHMFFKTKQDVFDGMLGMEGREQFCNTLTATNWIQQTLALSIHSHLEAKDNSGIPWKVSNHPSAKIPTKHLTSVALQLLLLFRGDAARTLYTCAISRRYMALPEQNSCCCCTQTERQKDDQDLPRGKAESIQSWALKSELTMSPLKQSMSLSMPMCFR